MTWLLEWWELDSENPHSDGRRLKLFSGYSSEWLSVLLSIIQPDWWYLEKRMPTIKYTIFWTLLRLDHDGSVTISRGKMPAPSGNQTWQACKSSILWCTYWKWWSSIANLVYYSLLSVDFGSVPCDDAFELLHLGRLEARRKKKFLRSITDWGATRSCYHENVILLNLVAGPAPVQYQGSLAVILR